MFATRTRKNIIQHSFSEILSLLIEQIEELVDAFLSTLPIVWKKGLFCVPKANLCVARY